MTDGVSGRPRWAVAAGILAVAFGGVTVFEGGRMLFGRPEIRVSAGNIVPFVLWFNFIAAFAYLTAGLGLLLWKRWAAQLSAGIAIGVCRFRRSCCIGRRLRGENGRRHDASQHSMDRDCRFCLSRPRMLRGDGTGRYLRTRSFTGVLQRAL